MRIPRIYQATTLGSDREIALDATASQHLLKVLRLREGATVIVFVLVVWFPLGRRTWWPGC